MANPEHVEILEQGVEAWNEWRELNPEVRPDLSIEDLSGLDLRGADLQYADFHGAILRRADLGGHDTARGLERPTSLANANLRHADLRDAKLDGAYLATADFTHATLDGVSFDEAMVEDTFFTDVNLAAASLANLRFWGPSAVDQRTLSRIRLLSLESGKQTEIIKFLQGCGLTDWEIEAAKLHTPGLTSGQITDITYKIHDLLTSQPIQISPIFISYSHGDAPFVDALEEHLNANGIRFWRDKHDATAGPLEKQVDRAIRLNPTVILVLSENSVESDWVKSEARAARELAKELKRDVLCPIALDDSWEKCDWPKRLKEEIMEYHILPFHEWKDEQAMQTLFGKLVKGLGMFYREGAGE